MKNKAGKIITALFLSGVLAIGAAPEISAETLSSENCYIYAAFDGTSVRKGPGTEYDKIGTIRGSGKLTYVEEQLDKSYIPWYKVRFKNGKEGWITSNYSRRYIKKSPFLKGGKIYKALAFKSGKNVQNKEKTTKISFKILANYILLC